MGTEAAATATTWVAWVPNASCIGGTQAAVVAASPTPSSVLLASKTWYALGVAHRHGPLDDLGVATVPRRRLAHVPAPRQAAVRESVSTTRYDVMWNTPTVTVVLRCWAIQFFC